MKCKKCKKEMFRYKKAGDKKYNKRYMCECGVKLFIIENFRRIDLYTWKKEDEIIEQEDIKYTF